MSQRTVTFYGLEAEVISAAIKQKDSRIAELEAQRDELLAALRSISTDVRNIPPTVADRALDRIDEIATEAIASVECGAA